MFLVFKHWVGNLLFACSGLDATPPCMHPLRFTSAETHPLRFISAEMHPLRFVSAEMHPLRFISAEMHTSQSQIAVLLAAVLQLPQLKLLWDFTFPPELRCPWDLIMVAAAASRYVMALWRFSCAS